MKKSVMKTIGYFVYLITALGSLYGNGAHAEPISRAVSAEIIAGYDFTVYQQQGPAFQFMYNDHSGDFTSRSDSPAQFNINIQTTRESIKQCSLHFITWQKQPSEELRQTFDRGGSLDVYYTPGLAGRISSDKTVFTGNGDFRVAYSKIKARFFGPTKGDPFNPDIAEDILSSLMPSQGPLKFASPLDTKPYGSSDVYAFQDFFVSVPKGQTLKWLKIAGSWGDERYVVYTLPCASLITLPELDKTAPNVSFSQDTLQVNSAGSGTSTLTIADDVGVSSSTAVQCTNGGSFSSSTFTAPVVTQNTTSICTVSASDAAGNTASGTLSVTITPTGTPPSGLILGGLAALIIAGALLAVLLFRRSAKLSAQQTPNGPLNFSRSMLSTPERPDQEGVIFASSALFAGAVAPGPTPLAPLGQMIPSGLQTLIGQFAALKPAYKATGRIGGPQEGVPTNDDVAFGTGFLITPNHIMTNQHVYEFYKHYLTGDDCGGIEFIAERDRDATDYVAFNGEPPVIMPDLDIAIFTLTRAVTDRTPIDRVAIPTADLDAREVVIVSYPCPFEVDETILAVVEEDPIFAVKRLSQGRVFRHSTDTDTSYGVMVKVDANINPARELLAICHNASTLGGSSGAPVLDLDGKLVGVHFAGDRAFNEQEAANLAMAIENLVRANPNKEST